MKIVYLVIGSIGLLLTVAALILPIVPATPFLIVALYGFSKGSKRMHDFIVCLPFIKPLYETLERERTFTVPQKLTLSVLTLPVAIVPLYLSEDIRVRALCIAVSLLSILIIWLYRHSPARRDL